MKPKNPHAQALGRMKSPAKSKASRENGRKGGRPKGRAFDLWICERCQGLYGSKPVYCVCSQKDEPRLTKGRAVFPPAKQEGKK